MAVYPSSSVRAVVQAARSVVDHLLLPFRPKGPGARGAKAKAALFEQLEARQLMAVTATTVGAAAVDEGASYALTMTATGLPAGATVDHWIVNWGDGAPQFVTTSDSQVTRTHVYADGPRTYGPTATIYYQEGVLIKTASAAPHQVGVNDLPPVFAAGGQAVVDEGATFDLHVVFDDPGTDSLVSWSVDWGDGTGGTYNTSYHSVDHIPHVYVDDTYAQITVTGISDQTYANTFTATTSVQVRDVAPSLTLVDASPAVEGSNFGLNVAYTDPGDDYLTHWTIDWGDGNTSDGSSLGTYDGLPGGAGSTGIGHVYADSGQYQVTLTADGDDGGPYAQSHSVTVTDVPPDYWLSAPGEVSEGDTYVASFGSTDRGDDNFAWTITWGDGQSDYVGYPDYTYDTYAGGVASGTAGHNYLDGSPGGTDLDITAVLADPSEGRQFSAGPVRVRVYDVAPTVSIGGVDQVPEGYEYELYVSATDPGQDTITEVVIDWGDGGGAQSYPGEVLASGVYRHAFAAPGSYSVQAWVSNEDGSSYAAQAPKYVTVDDQAPGVAVSGPATVAEGQNYTLETTYTANAPGDAVNEWYVDWGDGSTGTYSYQGSLAHTFDDGSAERTVQAWAVDGDGTYSAGAVTVGVTDVAPTWQQTVTPSVEGDQTYNASMTYGNYNDPGVDTCTGWTVHWDDGSAAETLDQYGGVANHTFQGTQSLYHVTVTAVNEDGSFTQTTDVWAAATPAPTDLAAEALSPTSVHLSWTDNAPGEHLCEVSRATDADFTQGVWNVGMLSRTGPGQVEFTDTTALSPEGVYFYRVRASSGTGQSEWATTPAEAGGEPMVIVQTPEAPPAAPTGVTATALADARLRVAWTDLSNNELGFVIETSEDGTHYSLAGVAGPNATSQELNLLPASTTLRVRVRAYNGGGESAPAAAPGTVTTTARTTRAPLTVTITGDTTYSDHSGFALSSAIAGSAVGGPYTYGWQLLLL